MPLEESHCESSLSQMSYAEEVKDNTEVLSQQWYHTISLMRSWRKGIDSRPEERSYRKCQLFRVKHLSVQQFEFHGIETNARGL